MNADWRSVPLPPQMRDMELDKRGFPIPFIVGRDLKGEPLFTINDSRKTDYALKYNLCGICGGDLDFGDLWWVGGPLSAFHPQGGFIDGPMHCECSTYALMVCPHLAAPKYTKRLDHLPAMKNGTDFKAFKDHTMMPDRPLVFIQGCSESYDVTFPLTHDRKFCPVSGPDAKNATGITKWKHYEVWQHGKLIEDEEAGLALIRQAFDDMNKQRVQQPKIMMPPPATLEI